MKRRALAPILAGLALFFTAPQASAWCLFDCPEESALPLAVAPDQDESALQEGQKVRAKLCAEAGPQPWAEERLELWLGGGLLYEAGQKYAEPMDLGLNLGDSLGLAYNASPLWAYSLSQLSFSAPALNLDDLGFTSYEHRHLIAQAHYKLWPSEGRQLALGVGAALSSKVAPDGGSSPDFGLPYVLSARYLADLSGGVKLGAEVLRLAGGAASAQNAAEYDSPAFTRWGLVLSYAIPY